MLSYYCFTLGPVIFFACLVYGQYCKHKAPTKKEKVLAEKTPNLIGAILGGPLIWVSLLAFYKFKKKTKGKLKPIW